MSAISDYAAAVQVAFTEIATAADEIVASIGGIASDVNGLKDKITQLENNPGPITPADQELLTASLVQASSLATRMTALKAAAKELDDATAAPPPPPA